MLKKAKGISAARNVRARALALMIGLTTVCASAPARAADAPFQDPWSYCKAVGTIDKADARYGGPAFPEPIVKVLQEKFKAKPRKPSVEEYQKNSFWRCMDGKVYTCTIGANIPCQEKADTSQTPSAGMVDYCKTNPVEDYIPAFVTGRATVYLWSCTDGKPRIVRELTKPDAAGYLSNVWYEVPPA